MTSSLRRPVKKPEWLKAKAPMVEFHALKKMARELNLHMCVRARSALYSGSAGTTGCDVHYAGEFVHVAVWVLRVRKGRPEPIDLDEPRRVAYAVAQLGALRMR